MATADDIALTLHPGLGPRGAVYLLSVFGSAENVYSAGLPELQLEAGLKPDTARSIVRKSTHREAEAEMRYLHGHGLAAIASTDEDYPALLTDCPDYPHVLYVRGNPGVLRGRALTIVGTRRITPYGQRSAARLVAELAACAPDTVLVSGLAFGTDAACHRAALENGLAQVAVLANPLPGVTPAQHETIAREIVRAGGALVSELHSGVPANPGLFVQRNRILAGMSAGTVVVESPLKGGSMITASLADGYQRSVMALPGRADDFSSAGCNDLIRRRKAQCVCGGADIAHELGWDILSPGRVPHAPVMQMVLTETEKTVVGVFGDGETLDPDTVSRRSGFGVGEVNAVLLEMELGGVLRQLPGKRYEKV